MKRYQPAAVIPVLLIAYFCSRDVSAQIVIFPTGDTVTHFGDGVGSDVPALLDQVGIGRSNADSETTETTFTVPGSVGSRSDLTFTFQRDTGTYQFTFGYFDVSSITADPVADRQAWAEQALQRATPVFDDREVGPIATQTVSVEAATKLGFFLLPNNTRDEFFADPDVFFSPIANSCFDCPRSPLFSISDANPGRLDQSLSFVGNGVTLFTFEDLTRAAGASPVSDQDFTDLAFTIDVELSDVQPLQFQAPFYKGSGHLLTTGPAEMLGDPGSHEDLVDQFAIDLAGGNVDVLAARQGRAYVHYRPDNYGNYVTIDHGPDPTDPKGERRIFTLYAHLETVNLVNGQPVGTGDVIGIEGCTGDCSGTHLHFGLHQGDAASFTGSSKNHPSIEFTPDLGTIRLGRNSDGPFEQFTTLCRTVNTACLANVPLGSWLYSDVEKDLAIRRTATILAGESIRHNLSVDPLTAFLDYELTWPGSELALDIFQPDGVLFDHLQETDGQIMGTILNPLPGVWSFKLTGVDLPPAGDPYTFSVAAHPVPEPQSLGLLAVALCCWLTLRGSRWTASHRLLL